MLTTFTRWIITMWVSVTTTGYIAIVIIFIISAFIIHFVENYNFKSIFIFGLRHFCIPFLHLVKRELIFDFLLFYFAFGNDRHGDGGKGSVEHLYVDTV